MRKGKAKTNLITSILLVIVCALAAFCGVACVESEPTETLEIKVLGEAYRDELIITQEYDVGEIIEKNEGVTYSLKNVFYINSSFERIDIPFNGMKFTQNEPYDVTVVIHGKSKTEYGDVTVELKIGYLTNMVERTLVASWNDEGVAKTYTANEEYRTGGAATAIKVRYLGEYNPHNDGVNFGSFIDAYKWCSYDNDENCVITFDVYNPNDYALTFGLQHSPDKNVYHVDMNVEALPKQWTKVAWSIHALGYETDSLLQGGHFGLKVRVQDDTILAPYDYTFYLCNPDIAEYDAEKFPGLETRTPEEIAQERFDSLQGDEIDRKLVGFAPATANYDVTTDTTVKKVGESSIKATFTMNKLKAFPTMYRGTMINDSKGVLSSVYAASGIDWTSAYFGVWVKNSPETLNKGFSMQLRFANTKDGETWRGSEHFEYDMYPNNRDIANIEEWQYLEWDLSAFGIETKNVTDYKFCLCAEMVLGEGESASFYLDDVRVFSKSVKKYLTGTHGTGYTAEINEETVHGDDKYSVKYTFDTASGARSTFMDDAGALFAYPEINKVESWSDKIYLGFWLKNETGFPINMGVRFANTQDGLNYKGWNLDWNFASYAMAPNVLTTTEWQYFEMSLSDEVTFNGVKAHSPLYTENVTGWKLLLATEIGGNGGSFYVSGLKVYSEGAKGYMASSHTDNYAAEIDTETVREGSDYSIKYTFTKGETGYPTPFRGTFLNDTTGTLFGYSSVNKVTDWSKPVYLGFWIKDTKAKGFNMAVRFANTQDGTTYKGWTSTWEMESYNMAPNIQATSEWQYFEIELSSERAGYEAIYTENVTGWKLLLATEIGENDSFYVSGLSVYNK